MTSPNAKTISGHAGKCPGFLIYEIQADHHVVKSHLKLSKEQTFKHFNGPLSQHPQHPLNGINIFITQSLGDGLLNRLKKDHIKVITTDETNPDLLIEELTIK